MFGINKLEEVNLYVLGARMYDPEIGRFLSPDPLLEMFPQHSPYHYAYNSPLIWKDPSGLKGEKEKGGDKLLTMWTMFQNGQIIGYCYKAGIEVWAERYDGASEVGEKPRNGNQGSGVGAGPSNGVGVGDNPAPKETPPWQIQASNESEANRENQRQNYIRDFFQASINKISQNDYIKNPQASGNGGSTNKSSMSTSRSVPKFSNNELINTSNNIISTYLSMKAIRMNNIYKAIQAGKKITTQLQNGQVVKLTSKGVMKSMNKMKYPTMFSLAVTTAISYLNFRDAYDQGNLKWMGKIGVDYSMSIFGTFGGSSGLVVSLPYFAIDTFYDWDSVLDSGPKREILFRSSGSLLTPADNTSTIQYLK